MTEDISVRDLARRVMKEVPSSYETRKIVSGLMHFAAHPPKSKAKQEELQSLVSEALSLLQ